MSLLILLIALQSAPAPNVDDDLFSDLGQELLEESAAQDPSKRADEALSPDDSALLEELGEDLGTDGANDPYERILREMQSASRLIQDGDTSGKVSTAQQQVLDDLAALIDQMRRRDPQSPASSSSSPQQSVRSQPEPPRQQSQEPQQAQAETSGPETQQSETAAQDSSNRLGRRDVDEVNVAGMEGLFEELWGHLPKRDRERMVESPFDRFLPKYEWEIERYFRRLAEDPDLSQQPRDPPPVP